MSLPVPGIRHVRTDFDAETEMWWYTSQNGRQHESRMLKREDKGKHDNLQNKTSLINTRKLTNLSVLQTTASTQTLLTKEWSHWQLENMEVENSSVTIWTWLYRIFYITLPAGGSNINCQEFWLAEFQNLLDIKRGNPHLQSTIRGRANPHGNQRT